MKFTVEVEDFWIEDGNLSEQLEKYVTRDVVAQISRSIESKVQTQITKKIEELVKKSLNDEIAKNIEAVMKEGKIGRLNRSSEQVTFEEYVRECLSYTGGWMTFQETVKKIAVDYSNELKKRYDILFASQVVAKMSENGLLKEDAVKLLLEK